MKRKKNLKKNIYIRGNMNSLELEVNCTNTWFLFKGDGFSQFQEFCSYHKGKDVIMIVKKKISSRSKKANDFYWGGIIKGFEREWPDLSKEQIHRILGNEFRKFRKSEEEIDRLKKLDKHDSEWNESNEWYIKSSSSMNSFEFWQYCERCIVQLVNIGGYLDVISLDSYEELKEKFNDKRVNK